MNWCECTEPDPVGAVGVCYRCKELVFPGIAKVKAKAEPATEAGVEMNDTRKTFLRVASICGCRKWNYGEGEIRGIEVFMAWGVVELHYRTDYIEYEHGVPNLPINLSGDETKTLEEDYDMIVALCGREVEG